MPLQVLGKMPNKTFKFTTSPPVLQPLTLPEDATPQAALERVLALPSVCSKRFLTTKVDRHVTGEPCRQHACIRCVVSAWSSTWCLFWCMLDRCDSEVHSMTGHLALADDATNFHANSKATAMLIQLFNTKICSEASACPI